MKHWHILSLLCAVCMSSCETAENSGARSTRKIIDLSGTWQFQLDPDSVGSAQNWFARDLEDSIQLPGTLDENAKGFKNKDTTNLHLNREYLYYGSAWFRKTIEIPDDWADKHVELIMERTKPTSVWLDSIYLGSESTILSRQSYDLTSHLIPGMHTLTIVVNNHPSLVPVEGSHAYAEHTQTNWNGIIGDFMLEASSPLRIGTARVYPDITKKEIRITTRIMNPEEITGLHTLRLSAEAWNTDQQHRVTSLDFHFSLPIDTVIDLTYPMGDNIQLWSEFNPALYRLKIEIINRNQVIDDMVLNFGMRDFIADGGQFAVNGQKIFLRGKHDAAVFPITGYPAMDVEKWTRIFTIAKTYGINHYRFHSWCPPEAAFMAADMEGIYLQPELPVWYGYDPGQPGQMSFMMHEGKRIMDDYGNHPSFTMFALGNEIHKDRVLLKRMVDRLRAYDSRHLYAQGSNNWLNTPDYWEGDDFWVTFRTDVEKEGLVSDIRGSMSFHDSKIGEGGLINTFYPSTRWTYEKAIEKSPVPVIGHETGQYQIYPDFREMVKYTGVLKPWNLEIFRRDLASKGMDDLADDFRRASGALAVSCYRADIEAALRTPGFGGFQLLDLQDFPGQGTALVGILDAFMDGKGLIQPEEFRKFNDVVVPLLLMEKYCWTNDEMFQGEIKVTNYGPSDLNEKNVVWQLLSNGEEIAAGRFNVSIPQGGLTTGGNIEADLSRFDAAQEGAIRITIEGTNYKNEYPVWIFPAKIETTVPTDIKIVSGIDESVIRVLNEGGSVLIFPDFNAIKDNSVGGLFIPDFWNWAMFQGIAEQNGTNFSPGTLGLLINDQHPLFQDFPTGTHSDWQWWPIAKNSRPMILDETENDFRPIVQTIDNINRNHKLGLIYEFKMGKGKALVCSSPLSEINRPEAHQLYSSILKYMSSSDFNPSHEFEPERLRRIFNIRQP